MQQTSRRQVPGRRGAVAAADEGRVRNRHQWRCQTGVGRLGDCATDLNITLYPPDLGKHACVPVAIGWRAFPVGERRTALARRNTPPQAPQAAVAVLYC